MIGCCNNRKVKFLFNQVEILFRAGQKKWQLRICVKTYLFSVEWIPINEVKPPSHDRVGSARGFCTRATSRLSYSASLHMSSLII